MTRTGWIGIAVLCTSCATTPPYNPPVLEITTPNGWTASAATGDAPDVTWWNDFGDTGLGDVVRIALEQNYDLAAAAARLEQAVADSRLAAADLQPTVQMGLNGSRRKQNFIGFPIPGSENRVLSTVLESQRLALQAEGDLIGARRQRLENRVDLYLALGGGFDQLASPVSVSVP